ncbi:MAG: O-antigen ligase family protein [Solirubrobacteraceae bacterium]
MSVNDDLTNGPIAVALDQGGSPARRRLRPSATVEAIAGNVGVSIFTQLGLLVSGVAGARILGVLDRGRSALLLLFATVLPLLITLGTPLAVTYWLARDKRLGPRLVRHLRWVMVAQIAALALVQAAVLVAVFHASSTHVQLAAAISLLGGPAIVVFFYALAALQGLQDFRKLNLCMLIFPPCNAAVLMALLFAGAKGLWMVTTVWVALYGISAAFTAAAARRSMRRSAGADGMLPSVGEMLRFGLKAQLGSMSPLTGFQLDQAIVGLFISQAALGIYSVAVAFTNLPRFVAQSIGLVAYPYVAAADGRGRSRAILKFAGLTLVLCGAIVIAIEFVLPVIVGPLYGHAFAPASGVAQVLLVSSLLFSMTRVLSDCARGDGRAALGTVAEIVSLVMLFPFVALFSGHGAKGVAAALALASCCGVGVMVLGLLIRRDLFSRRAPRRRAERTIASRRLAANWPGGRRRPRRPRRRRESPSSAWAVTVSIVSLVLVAVAIAAGGLGPAGGAAVGVLVIGTVALLGISADRLMWGTICVLVLTITWNGIRIGAGGSFANVFLAMAFAALIVALVLERRAPLVPSWLMVAAIGFILSGLLTGIFPVSHALNNRALLAQESLATIPGYLPARSNVSYLFKFEFAIIVMPLIIANAVTTSARWRQLLDIWTVGATINAAAGLAHVGPTAINGTRAAGLTIHPNYLALSALMGIPPALTWIGRSRRWTWAGLVAVPVLAGGVYASGSRDGIVTLVGMVALTLVSVPRFRRRVLPTAPLILASVAAVVTLLLMFTNLGNRILSQVRLGGGARTGVGVSGSNSQRWLAAHVAFAQISARPIEGVGYSVIEDAQNIYLQVLAAGGVVAMASFLVYLGGLAAAARRAWRFAASDEVMAVSVVIVGWLVNGVFDSQLADKYVYVVPGLLVAMGSLAAAERRRSSSAAPVQPPSTQPTPGPEPAARVGLPVSSVS